jgi:hypothetical protein
MSDESSEFETPVIEGQEGEQEAALEVLTPAEKKRVNSLMLKYNGKEYEEKLPFEIDEEHADWMRKQLQLSKMSQSKSQEFANSQKEMQSLQNEVVAFINELKTNPRKALSNPMVGLDIKQLAAEILEEEIENSRKSPDQLEKEQYQRELKALKDEREAEKKASEQIQEQATLERLYDKYDNMIAGALDGNPDLPQTPYIVDKMTKYMAIAVDEGYEPDMSIITDIVRGEINDDIKHLMTILPPDQIEKILGKDVLNKLRTNRLAGSKKAPPTVKSIVKDVAPQKPAAQMTAMKKQTIKDFFGA